MEQPVTPGEKLKARRKELGMRQADVATAVGRAVSHVCQVERGLAVSRERQEEIARAVGASAGSFWP